MKTVLVVGVSGGIGKRVAKNLLDNGYYVNGTYYRRQKGLSEFSNSESFKSHKLDVSDVSSIKSLKNSLIGNKLFAIVNCAGIVKFEGKSIEQDIDIWNEAIAVNLSSNYLLAKYFYSSLEENGRFIMISSTDSYYGGEITASYAASKSGVNSLAKSLSLSLKNKKIRVNAIAPGWVSTPMIEGNSEEFYQKLADVNPLKRIAEPEDIAGVIKFLLSKDADYINGQVITVDGGYTNQDPTILIEEEQN